MKFRIVYNVDFYGIFRDFSGHSKSQWSQTIFTNEMNELMKLRIVKYSIFMGFFGIFRDIRRANGVKQFLQMKSIKLNIGFCGILRDFAWFYGSQWNESIFIIEINEVKDRFKCRFGW